MKISIVSLSRAQRPVASNLTAKEFLAEAHVRFPQPSPFLADFLQRFADLVELEAAVEKQHFEEETSQDVECPACGHQLTIEVELEALV